MIKLKKHLPLDKEKIIKVLDTVTKISILGGEYYWIFEDYFKISDRHADKYDEVSEDITRLFVDGIGYKDLYNSWGTGTTLNRRLPFFSKHHVHGTGFIVDVISDVIHSQRTLTGAEKYDRLAELYNLSLYLMENQLPKDSDITQETLDESKTYIMKKEKLDKIRKRLLEAMAPKEVIDDILAMV